jgi:hypothetical protein
MLAFEAIADEGKSADPTLTSTPIQGHRSSGAVVPPRFIL